MRRLLRPQWPIVTVVLIFVVDLSLIIFQRIRWPEAERLKPERVPNCEQAG